MAGRLTRQDGFAQRGVLGNLAHNAITFAGGLALGGDAPTSQFKTNQRKPAEGSFPAARVWAEGIAWEEPKA